MQRIDEVVVPVPACGSRRFWARPGQRSANETGSLMWWSISGGCRTGIAL
jgi:hypothetical protein